MAPKFNERWFGFLGLLGFAGFTDGNAYLYSLFMLFFIFLFARPPTKEGNILSDERWSTNITKAGRNGFFVFLIPSVLAATFLTGTEMFTLAFKVIPIVALLSFVAFFMYYDWRGD